jgi:hypothetical protein
VEWYAHSIAIWCEKALLQPAPGNLIGTMAIKKRRDREMTSFKKYGFLWITTILFVGSLIGHWMFAWYHYVDEQNMHAQPIEVSGYVIETAKDTLENWQSEFLQLIWQVAGLAFFLFVGSPQSKEGDDRKEAKLDTILSKLDPDHYKEILRDLERKYPKA